MAPEKVERRRNKLMQEFESCADFIDSLDEEEIESLWNAAKSAPNVSWFLEEKVGNKGMILLEHPIFFGDKSKAALLARSASQDEEVEEVRLMKWTRRIRSTNFIDRDKS